MSAPCKRISSTNEDQSVLLADIEELKGKKRPRALTEEQRTDILVAYRSLQISRKLMCHGKNTTRVKLLPLKRVTLHITTLIS